MILTAVIASSNAMCCTSLYGSLNVGNKCTTQKPEVSIMTCVQNAQLDGCTLSQVGANGAIPFPHQSRRTGFNPRCQPMWRNDYSVPQLGSEPSPQIRKFGGCLISYTSCSIFEVCASLRMSIWSTRVRFASSDSSTKRQNTPRDH
jgi:hypothetical protein